MRITRVTGVTRVTDPCLAAFQIGAKFSAEPLFALGSRVTFFFSGFSHRHSLSIQS